MIPTLPPTLIDIADWLEDCEDHLALGKPGDLPRPPWRFAKAHAAVRWAAKTLSNPAAPCGAKPLNPKEDRA